MADGNVHTIDSDSWMLYKCVAIVVHVLLYYRVYSDARRNLWWPVNYLYQFSIPPIRLIETRGRDNGVLPDCRIQADHSSLSINTGKALNRGVVQFSQDKDKELVRKRGNWH